MDDSRPDAVDPEHDDDPVERPRWRRFGGGVMGGAARRRLQSLSFNRIFPNMLTLLALCAGLTAIRYGLNSQWDRAAAALVIAATLDGVDGGLTGIMLLSDGRILGGDAFFYYLGTYTSVNGRWKGQIVNQEHTPSRGENPVFGGHEVGIGFSGACSDTGAELEATALAGKRSIRLTAVLKLMRNV